MFGWLKVCYYRWRLRHRDDDVAQSAVGALAELGAVDEVIQALDHDSDYVAQSAVEALAKLGAVDGLMQALDRDSDYVTRSAVEALAELGAVDRLMQAFDRPRLEGNERTPPALELMQTFDRPRLEVQGIAALKLAESGVTDPRFVEPLIKLLAPARHLWA